MSVAYDYAAGLGNERLPPPDYEKGELVFPLPGDPDEVAGVIAYQLWRNCLTPAALDTGTMRIDFARASTSSSAATPSTGRWT